VLARIQAEAPKLALELKPNSGFELQILVAGKLLVESLEVPHKNVFQNRISQIKTSQRFRAEGNRQCIPRLFDAADTNIAQHAFSVNFLLKRLEGFVSDYIPADKLKVNIQHLIGFQA
jgi:hypothetical protein